MFQITHQPINPLKLKEQIMTRRSGAVSIFEGTVRNHHEGREVLALEYEAYDGLSEIEAAKIIAEAKAQFHVHHVACVHRVGRLEIGEIAVWIGVTASHRDDAFKACRYVIDEIKKRLPIWKKEYYSYAEPQWVNCSCQHHHDSSETEIYSRQVILPDIGKDGQKKIKKTRVLVVGAGGLGSPVLLYLAAAGVGTIGICEHDVLEASNLNRQTLYSYQDIGQPKGQLAARRIHEFNPFIHIALHPEKLNCHNIEAIVSNYDLIIDCTDDMTTKFLLSDCAVLKSIPLIQASIYQHEGQIQFIYPKANTACLRCLWEQIPSPECVGTCQEAGVIGVVPGYFGILQAAEALKAILHGPESLSGDILLCDMKSCELTRLKLPKNNNCIVCSEKATMKEIHPRYYQLKKNIVDMDIFSLLFNDFCQFTLVDIREDDECREQPIDVHNYKHMASSQLHRSEGEFDKQTPYLLFCRKGIRSQRLAQELRLKGYQNVYSVVNGVDAVETYLHKNKKEVTA